MLHYNDKTFYNSFQVIFLISDNNFLLFRGNAMAIGIICEFNPFHNGHKYLIQKAKSLVNEPVVVVMSTSFTQRGEIAITDKFTRAKSALLGGADLVIELPVAYAVSNAEVFAKSGVKILSSFSRLTHLAFGCENSNIELLKQTADAHKNTAVQSLVAKEMQNGSYYPKAIESAVRAIYGDKTAEILATPNNVLAVEYLKALPSNISPLPIRREGVEHDSENTENGFASASYIREQLKQGKNIAEFAPFEPAELALPDNLETALLYKLRSMSVHQLADLPDVTEGLENRIYTAVHEYNSVNEILFAVKSKRYTLARLRRILICALLNITKEIQNTEPCYARVLGFTNDGAKILKSCTLPVITSVKKGLSLGGNTEKLLKTEIFATDVFSLAVNPPKKCGADFTTPIIKI